jgi:hypothetical protein
MIARGRVRNGVVELDGDSRLPEGTPVVVWPDPAAIGEAPPEGDEHRRFLQAIDRIASMPIEGSNESFRGADHDQALYGRT